MRLPTSYLTNAYLGTYRSPIRTNGKEVETTKKRNMEIQQNLDIEHMFVWCFFTLALCSFLFDRQGQLILLILSNGNRTQWRPIILNHMSNNKIG